MVSDNQSALLVPARDPAAMAAAVARMLTDPGLAQRLAANATELIASRFSPETHARALVKIYREVIAGRS